MCKRTWTESTGFQAPQLMALILSHEPVTSLIATLSLPSSIHPRHTSLSPHTGLGPCHRPSLQGPLRGRQLQGLRVVTRGSGQLEPGVGGKASSPIHVSQWGELGCQEGEGSMCAELAPEQSRQDGVGLGPPVSRTQRLMCISWEEMLAPPPDATLSLFLSSS